jgi:hypothetical protein
LNFWAIGTSMNEITAPFYAGSTFALGIRSWP